MENLFDGNSHYINGDCMKYMKQMPDKCIDLAIVDPPYKCISGGESLDENGIKKKGTPSGILSKNDGKIFENNNIKCSEWIPELFRVLKDDTDCYIMTNLINMTEYLNVCKNSGFKLHNLLIWEKNNCTPSRWYMKNCEYVIYLYKGNAKPINNHGSKTVHKFNNIIKTKNHPTEKPTELMEFYILNSSKKGDIVMDSFMGTGSTGVAAIRNGRKFIGVEIDKTYYDIAVARLEAAMNQQRLFCIGSGTTAIACINTNRNYIGFELDKHYCEIAEERIQKATAK